MEDNKMSDADMKKREEIVKSMKKSFKDFRKRYGDRAKEVMYATATKMAMKEAIDSEDKGEYDYEGDMAKSALKTIIRNAQMMHDMLEDETNLPEWVQGKITLAEDYIVSASQYMQSEMKEEVENIDEEEYDYQRDYRSGGATRSEYGRAVRNYQRRSAQSYKRAPEKKVPHAVHINGKKWKSFSSQGHATNVAKKIIAKGGKKKITIHREDS